jgi:hypothetical protein
MRVIGVIGVIGVITKNNILDVDNTAINGRHTKTIDVTPMAENAKAKNAKAENAKAENVRAENVRAENARAENARAENATFMITSSSDWALQVARWHAR